MCHYLASCLDHGAILLRLEWTDHREDNAGLLKQNCCFVMIYWWLERSIKIGDCHSFVWFLLGGAAARARYISFVEGSSKSSSSGTYWEEVAYSALRRHTLVSFFVFTFEVEFCGELAYNLNIGPGSYSELMDRLCFLLFGLSMSEQWSNVSKYPWEKYGNQVFFGLEGDLLFSENVILAAFAETICISMYCRKSLPDCCIQKNHLPTILSPGKISLSKVIACSTVQKKTLGGTKYAALDDRGGCDHSHFRRSIHLLTGVWKLLAKKDGK